MSNYKLFELKPMTIGFRKVHPIVKLNVFCIKSDFLSLDYEVAAFKIEDKQANETYYKNVSLSDLEFKKLEI